VLRLAACNPSYPKSLKVEGDGERNKMLPCAVGPLGRSLSLAGYRQPAGSCMRRPAEYGC